MEQCISLCGKEANSEREGGIEGQGDGKEATAENSSPPMQFGARQA